MPVANACAHGELEAIGKHAFGFMTGRAGDGAGRREACVKIQKRVLIRQRRGCRPARCWDLQAT
jgi:hypothetical protein